MTIADSFREQADQVEVKHQMPIFPEEEACLVVLEVACWVVPEVAYLEVLEEVVVNQMALLVGEVVLRMALHLVALVAYLAAAFLEQELP